MLGVVDPATGTGRHRQKQTEPLRHVHLSVVTETLPLEGAEPALYTNYLLSSRESQVMGGNGSNDRQMWYSCSAVIWSAHAVTEGGGGWKAQRPDAAGYYQGRRSGWGGVTMLVSRHFIAFFGEISCSSKATFTLRTDAIIWGSPRRPGVQPTIRKSSKNREII